MFCGISPDTTQPTFMYHTVHFRKDVIRTGEGRRYQIINVGVHRRATLSRYMYILCGHEVSLVLFKPKIGLQKSST